MMQFGKDPRWFQTTILSLLLFYGNNRLNFAIGWDQIVVLLGTTLGTQYVCGRLFNMPPFDPRSPLISALSLCLLLRTNSLLLMHLAAVLTILSKFVLQWNGKHIFNPTNIGLVGMMLLTDDVWVSPGQWGSKVFFAFFLACLGGLVIRRAARSDVSYAFLFLYASMLAGRALWLGDPLTIPLHQLQSGAFLIFTFFMISDPKTTPDSRRGRILFALLVSALAVFIQFGLFRTNGMLWSLALCSPLTPLIDRWLPGDRYEWTAPKPLESKKGVYHETISLNRSVVHCVRRESTGLWLLRLLCREGGYEDLQQGFAGGSRARGGQDRHNHGQRFQG